jgi:hypothetical protein
MVFAFLMSGALVFYLGAPRFNIASDESDSRWFTEMYLAVFSPIFLLLAWRLRKRACAGRQTCMLCRGTVDATNLDDVGLCSYCRESALQENDDEQGAWVRKVKAEFGERRWASDLRKGWRDALCWKRRILTSR